MHVIAVLAPCGPVSRSCSVEPAMQVTWRRWPASSAWSSARSSAWSSTGSPARSRSCRLRRIASPARHPFAPMTTSLSSPTSLLRGRCRACGARIPPRDALLELGTAVLFVLLAWRLASVWALPAYCVLAASAVAISAIDFEHMRIPSAVVYATAALGAPLLVLASAGTHRWSALASARHRRRGRLRRLLRPLLRRAQGHRLRRRALRGSVRRVPRLAGLSRGGRRFPDQLRRSGSARRLAARDAQGEAAAPRSLSARSSPPAR